MSQVLMRKDVAVGVEPGLRFGTLITPSGYLHDLNWDGIRAWTPEQGFLWVHLERDDPTAQAWLKAESGIDPLVVLALLAEDTRPRVQDVDDALVVVLRGVNMAEETSDAELVPIQIWMESTRCISLRDKDHQLTALRDIRLLHMGGRGPRTAGGLLAMIAEKVVDHLSLVIEAIEEEVGKLEEDAVKGDLDKDFRTDISWARRRAIDLRRYLGPQRDALYRLQRDDASWLCDNSKIRLREVSDRLLRDIEDLNALRDRTSVLHEDLSALMTERMARTSNRLTAVAAMLLPPTVITGLLGTNIGGIPGATNDYAFWWLCLVLVGMIPFSWLVLRILKWM